MTDQDLKIRSRIISNLLAPFGQSASGSAEQIVGGYLAAIDGVETGYVAEAARRLLSGEATRPAPSFAPSPTELANEARRLRNNYLDKVNRDRLAQAQIEQRTEPLTEEEQERRRAFIASALRRMPQDDGPRRVPFSEMPQERAERELEELAKGRMEPAYPTPVLQRILDSDND